MMHCLICEVLWSHAGAATSRDPGSGPLHRLALGPEVDRTARIAAVAQLICTYGLYHVVKVPWAARLPPEACRDAPPAVSSAAEVRAQAKVAAARIPGTRAVSEALARARADAHASATARQTIGHSAPPSPFLVQPPPLPSRVRNSRRITKRPR